MQAFMRINGPMALAALLLVAGGVAEGRSAPLSAPVPAAYTPITPTMADQTVTLTGHDLTIEQVIEVARYGAKVRLSPAVIKNASDAKALEAEAAAEGISVYGVNRGAGALREVKKPVGQPDTPVPPWLNTGVLPEVSHEDLIRAIMVISANAAAYSAGAPERMQMLLDLLNKRVTPVFYSRGGLGEGDLPLLGQVSATEAGRGDAYYMGVRMKASEALRRAGIKPIAPDGEGGGGVDAEDAYADALAALLVYDGRQALEWTDLICAMGKIGMNSSLTPMTAPVQANRPFKWVNWDAARIMDMLRGSYLFEDDPGRILQDPESMRASYIRQGSAWQAWAALRDDVLLQINSSDHNPMVLVGVSPTDSWELSTPQMMKYYVKGGPLSHGMHGYIFSTANWDPYPMTNDVEAFTNALANMDAVVAERIERFSDRRPTPFFTGIFPKDVLTPAQINASPALSEPYFVFMSLWAQIQDLARSVTAEGNAADLGVADIEAYSTLKGANAREVVDLTMELLGYDLLTSTYWMDVRKAQNAGRNFGRAPTAAWTAFRKIVPWQLPQDQRPEIPYGVVAYEFLKSTPASSFYLAGPAMPKRQSE